MELLWPAAPVGLMRTASSLVLLKSQQASLAKLLQLDLSLKPSSQRDLVMSLGLEAIFAQRGQLCASDKGNVLLHSISNLNIGS